MPLSTPPPPSDPLSTAATETLAVAAAAAASTSTAPSTIALTTTSAATTTPPRPIFPPNTRPPPSHPHPSTSHPFQAPFFSNHPHPHPHPLSNPANSRLSSNPNPNYSHLVVSASSHSREVAPTTTSTPSSAVLYPVASSGRGFLTKQTPSITLANPKPGSALYQSRPGLAYPRQPFGYSHSDLGLQQGMGYVTGRQTHAAVAGVMPGVIKGVPVTGTSSQPQHKITILQNPNSDCNGHKDTKSKDESACTTIRDRKVRVSDNASVYALCRSWLRNGFPEDSQLQYMDSLRSLPRPLPLSAQDVVPPMKEDDDKEVEEEDEGSVEHLTPKEVLQRHVKHAKRVRSRLREERLQRLERYKLRLGLLLPPMVDPQSRSDI